MYMAEEEESAAMTNSSPKQPPLCEECRKNPSKYKCPGCSLRTCCLPCVKAHKERTACTGKKQYNDVVPLSRFDDNLLLSDYTMLEDVKRVVESGRRMRFKSSSHFRLPFPLKSLRSAAASRRTKLLFYSSGMSKREKNRTYYNYRKKYISWTIEWRFHSTDVVLTDHGIHENRSLFSVIENHLKPGPWKHQLRQFCELPLDCLKFFIRKYPKGPRSPFRELNLKGSIREQLSNLVVLEYPVIHVFLPSHSYNFEVIKDANPCRVEDKDKETSKNDELCQTGVMFREEVVEEGGSSNPHVLDLMNTSNVEEEFTTSIEKKDIDKQLIDAGECRVDSKLVARTIQGSVSDLTVDANDAYIGCNSEDMAVCGNVDFDFDQGLVDAYMDLMAQTNLHGDSFLEFGGILPEVGLEGERGHADFITADEELEEGEIV